MEYQVLARKWRPSSFSDMIGQEHITKTLQNALISNKTAHAYLFVGPRGIGKTTIARIFAKALNCREAPAINPCDKCESCLSITRGNSIDVIEIDGASNNSVEDVRKLREEVLFTPAYSRYKIYIIDEVHMLSNQAWNALLKTLEEPPPHVKFIFATTEVHKILPTVLSRCQRFDLRRIPMNLIVDRLSKIALSEKVTVSSNALRAIAKAADGGMRDALSLLDQLIAFHSSDDNKSIDESQVLNTFGITSPEKLDSLMASIVTADYPGVVESIGEAAREGKNLEMMFADILEYLRGMEIVLLVRDPDSILEAGNEMIETYRRTAARTTLDFLQRMLESLSPVSRMLHDAINKQIFLETSLFKAIRFASSYKIEDIISRLNAIRKSGNAEFLNAYQAEKKNLDAPVVQKPETEIGNKQQNSKPVQSASSENLSEIKQTPASSADNAKPQEPSVTTAKPQVSGHTRDNAARQESRNINFDPKELWHKLITEMDSEHVNNPQLKFWMQEAIPQSITNDNLTILFDEEFKNIHAERIRHEKHMLESCLHRITGNNKFTLTVKMVRGLIPLDQVPKTKDMEDVKRKIDNNPFVKTLIDTFNGKIVDFRG